MSKIANSVINLRIPPEEKQAWESQAEAEGMSLSAWIKHRCSGVYTNPPEAKNVYTEPEPDKYSLHSVISRLGTLR